MKNKFPLSLSTYYLNFSYPGELNLQSRVFVNIPFAGQSVQPSEKLSFIQICFEMSSVFNKGVEYKKDGIDLGLKVMLNIEELYIPEKNIKNFIEDKMREGNPKFKKIIYFDSQADLLNNLLLNLNNFIYNSYGDNWTNFVLESRKKYFEKHLAYSSNEEKDEKTYIQTQLIKTNKFYEETIRRMDLLLSAEKIDENLLKKMNATLNSSGSSIVNQILASSPIDDRVEIMELNKILKIVQYNNLNKELPVKDNSHQKPKKI
jgi:hypothetical protein